MEEFVGLIPIIIIAIVSAVSKSVKNQQKTQQHPYQQWMNSARPPVAQPAAAQAPAPAAQPIAPAVPASMAAMLPPRQEGPRQAAAPLAHPHLAPDCDIHDAPTMGSLGVTSPEGKDPCHEDQLTSRRAATTAPEATQPGIALDWNGEAMVKAFVMQEVLTRPCERRRR